MMSNFVKSDQISVISVPRNERITRLTKLFKEEFDCIPSFYVRVPGRVNIIGEHIDYCGYPVLPMALEQDILIAAGLITEHKIQVRNVNNKYVSFDASVQSLHKIDLKPDLEAKPYWYNYILCGVRGALEYLDNKIINGIQLFIDGNIPPALGLSSSSALVSAACLCFLYAQNSTLSKTEMASLCAKSERYIGTQGGGMDQAIAFLAEKNSAQYITWQPLNATSIALPENATFVIANSLAEANKAASNDFNRRVIECRLAAKLLASVAGITLEKKIITLSQLQTDLDNSLEDMITLVLLHIPKDVYTKEEICGLLNIDEKEIDELYLTPDTRHVTEFKLKQRALHVFEEAKRVEEFRNICSQFAFNENNTLWNGINGSSPYNTNDEIANGTSLHILGKLMSNSHKSLKNLYECSHDNLDLLVDISNQMNVYARLTGAGWGGCVVALCPKEKVEEYIKMLKNEFYAKHCKLDSTEANTYVFATTANEGAVIYVNKEQ